MMQKNMKMSMEMNLILNELYKNLFYIKMIINEKEISTFKEDTKEDLFYRISVSFDTLPEYISEIKDDQVYFINELIFETRDSFEDFYKSLPIFPYLDPETLIHLWLFYKKKMRLRNLIIILIYEI